MWHAIIAIEAFCLYAFIALFIRNMKLRAELSLKRGELVVMTDCRDALVQSIDKNCSTSTAIVVVKEAIDILVEKNISTENIDYTANNAPKMAKKEDVEKLQRAWELL